jgi:hypothetical protein
MSEKVKKLKRCKKCANEKKYIEIQNYSYLKTVFSSNEMGK